MKKRILTAILAVTTASFLLMGCGADKSRETSAPVEAAPAETPTPAEEPAPAKEEAAGTSEAEMVSDETFAELQENFQLMSECYDAVLDLYSSDEIAANADIEEAMLLAAEVIDEMGEITQDSITEEDAETLNQAMVDILDGLSDLVDGMEIADGAEGDMVSDETFAILQENYQTLTEVYNAVAEAYNSDEVEANAEIEDLMTQAAATLEEMGNIEQESLTEADAVEFNEAMQSMLEGLQVIANAIG